MVSPSWWFEVLPGGSSICVRRYVLSTAGASCEFRRGPLFLIAGGPVADGTIEDGMVEPFDGFVRLGQKVEDDDFVAAFAQPRTGDVERLLRADGPEAAEVVAVDPDEDFAEVAGVEKGVVGGGEGKVGSEECGRLGAARGGCVGCRRDRGYAAVCDKVGERLIYGRTDVAVGEAAVGARGLLFGVSAGGRRLLHRRGRLWSS